MNRSRIPVTCYTAAIVKGIAEHDDATRFFGSISTFNGHLHDAKALGLVQFCGRKLTEDGRRFYEKAQLAKLPDTRAYYWSTDEKWGSRLQAALAP